MNNDRQLDYKPDILGMQWNPGDLVLVAGSVVARSIYINGNIIAKGTGTDPRCSILTRRRPRMENGQDNENTILQYGRQ